MSVRNGMNRKPRSQKELRAASDHLYYEIGMLTCLAQGLASGVTSQGPIHDGLVESVAIHARNLLDFLYAERPRDDDVIAEDFFKDPTIWHKARRQKSQILEGIHKRVGKEVAHLTYARQKVTPEEKPWPVDKIAQEVDNVFSCFLEAVSQDLLGPRWDNYKKAANAHPRSA